MKKVIVLIVFMIGFNNLTNAQWQNCGFSHTLNQVSIRDSAIYVLDGTVGDIYASLNNGNTWNLLSGLTNHGITSFALQGTNIFACSGNRGIYLSTDNGVTWIQKTMVCLILI